MSTYTYDCEVTMHNWLVVFKDFETGQYTCIWDNADMLREFLDTESLYIGFNSKHYDQFIIRAIVNGWSHKWIKHLNDFIINGGQGWEYLRHANDTYFAFRNVDIKDDMLVGLSLKSIEGHLGMDIEETEVDFDIDRPLTQTEKDLMLKYCKHDVDATEEIIRLREDYLKNKIKIGALAGLPFDKALSMTNAKLTAIMLKAKKKAYSDERDYQYPVNLKSEYIPDGVFEFFNQMKNENYTDEYVFSSKYKFRIGDCEVVLGYGGIHGAIPTMMAESNEDRVIRNYDVASYYPHLMTLCGYTSRNIPSKEVFENVLETRMKAKASGDKATANALKLVVNTTYGAMLNQYNDLYDPLMGRSVCITGQLFLLELTMHLTQEIKDLKVIQINTDGVMIECYKSDLDNVYTICNEWQTRTGFELEEDCIKKMVQKDVNNYIEIQDDGSTKLKGGYLVRGISTVGAFNVNNNFPIVSKAITEYFVNGTPVEETINNCDNLLDFQIIAKASSKYKEVYHLVNDEKIKVQKVNRVYASKDESLGKLYKIKKVDNSVSMIASLPEHCLIDNNNLHSIEDIDKGFYINMAKSRINDFLGIKEEKKKRRQKMATATKTKNVYQKLNEAREKFLNMGVEKSGKNMHLSFKYFELDDIVPQATKIFNEIGIISLVRFSDETAAISIINTDNAEEEIVFTAPFNQIKPIVSNSGKQATNEMQALGSSITYMRRYLYMIALDICEADSIEANLGVDAPKEDKKSVPLSNEKTTEPKKFIKPEERKAIKEELTNTADEKASSLQIKGLKNVLKKLKDTDPSQEEFIAKIALNTNGFKDITKSECEEIVKNVTLALEKLGDEK